MAAWVWIVMAAAVAFVLWLAFVRRWLHGVLYAWRRSRHLIAQTQAEPVPAPEYIPEMMPAPEYGSMVLAAERDWLDSAETYGPVMAGLRERYGTLGDDPDWREQYAAELNPEALKPHHRDYVLGRNPVTGLKEWQPPEDSGPGLSSFPGPDPAARGSLETRVEAGAYQESSLPGPANGSQAGAGAAGTSAAPPTRLADTGDLHDASLLADVQADMRAREDGCLGYLAAFGAACDLLRRELTEALA